MKPEDAEEFTQSLGQIVGGSWRQIRLAEKLGVPKALGLSTKEWVERRLGGYAKLTVEQLLGVYQELRAEEPDISFRALARTVGISQTQIRREMGEPDGSPEEQTNSNLESPSEPNGSPENPVDAVAAHRAEHDAAFVARQCQHNLRLSVFQCLQYALTSLQAFAKAKDDDLRLRWFDPKNRDHIADFERFFGHERPLRELRESIGQGVENLQLLLDELDASLRADTRKRFDEYLTR